MLDAGQQRWICVYYEWNCLLSSAFFGDSSPTLSQHAVVCELPSSHVLSEQKTAIPTVDRLHEAGHGHTGNVLFLNRRLL